MAYVKGDLGKKIEQLMETSNNQYNDKKYKESVQILIQAWDFLPDGKNEYDESYLIVWRILDIAIKNQFFDIMKEWVDKIFDADPERPDTGEREMWAGRVAFELRETDKAFKYFSAANTKSTGRCFGNKDHKYFEFFMNEKAK